MTGSSLPTRRAILKYFFILSSLVFLPEFSYGEGMIIRLPAPKEKGTVSLEEAVKKRRSERNLSGRELTIGQIGQLLWASQGITDRDRNFRSSPSAGATYPLEIYIVKKDGLFHYVPQSHSLERLDDKDLREGLSLACYGQGFIKSAAIDIVICAEFDRTMNYYGDRGEHYVYIEVGHAAQNIHLEAVAEGLGSVPVGAFSDDKVKEVLSLPRNLVPLYIIPVGYIKE